MSLFNTLSMPLRIKGPKKPQRLRLSQPREPQRLRLSSPKKPRRLHPRQPKRPQRLPLSQPKKTDANIRCPKRGSRKSTQEEDSAEETINIHDIPMHDDIDLLDTGLNRLHNNDDNENILPGRKKTAKRENFAERALDQPRQYYGGFPYIRRMRASTERKSEEGRREGSGWERVGFREVEW